MKGSTNIVTQKTKANQPINTPFKFSLFEKQNGILSKHISLDFMGNTPLSIDSNTCALSKGTAKTMTLDTLSQLPDVFFNMRPNQAIGLGIGTAEFSQIAPAKAIENCPGAISRSKDNFHWPESSLGAIDYDPAPTGFPIDGPEKLVSILGSIDHQWEDIEFVRTFSTSAGIYAGDVCLKPVDGMHLYFRMEGKPHNIERYWRVLFKKLWLAGHGHLFITKDGKMLPRTVFDKAILSPERLLFEAGASLGEGLTQKRPPAEYFESNGGALNVDLVPAFFPHDENEYETVLATAKRKQQKDADKQRGTYITARANELVKAHGGRISQTQARTLVDNRIQLRIKPRDRIHLDDDGWISASDVLADPQKYDGKTCADPIEPHYGSSGTDPAWNKAVIRLNGSKISVFSQAHGGRIFTVEHDAESLIQLLDSMDDSELATSWAHTIAIHDLNRTELNQIHRFLKTRLGLSKKDFEHDLAAIDGDQVGPEDNHAAITEELISKYLDQEYPDGLISTNGTLYAHTGNIWQAIKANGLTKLIGMRFSDLTTCKRRGDYKAILAQTLDNLDEPGFFGIKNAPLGVAASGLFYRLHDDGQITTETCEPMKHRIRFMLDAAPDANSPTPNWDAFLESSLGGVDYQGQVELLQELMGATVFGLMPLFQKVVLLHGPTDSGKSLVTRLVMKLFPDYMRTSIPPAEWVKEGHRAGLADKRLNIAGDLPHDAVIQAGIFKTITGDDPFSIRNLYKDVVPDVRNSCAHWFTANHFASTKADAAFFGRFCLLSFPNTITKSEQIKDLESTIIDEELPGLLHWMFTGAQRVIQQNAFSETATHKKLTHQWQLEANTVKAFLHDQEYVQLTKNKTNRIERSKLYTMYTDWCRAASRKNKSKQHALYDFDLVLGAAVKSDGTFYYDHIKDVVNRFG